MGAQRLSSDGLTSQGIACKTLTVETPQPSYPEPVFQTLCEAIPQIDPQRTARAIGVGMPGPADAAGRIARIAINMDGWQDVPLADWLETKFPTTNGD